MPDVPGIPASPAPIAQAAGAATGHERHCFIVMPYGGDQSEKRWFRGWLEVVIKPAVTTCSYEPILAATEEQPGAINDEIRAHLAFDPMVVVDLGGVEPDDDPNPNVMYELGIRHALGLPLVMMAWQGQRLPFDVGNQRVIMEQRDFVDLDTNKKRLVAFIRAAAEGRYYRPMEAVSRIATIEAASTTLGEDSILGALVREVRDLRTTFTAVQMPVHFKYRRQSGPTIRSLLRAKPFRKELYPHFLALGGKVQQWTRLTKMPVTHDFVARAENWTADEWKEFLTNQLVELGLETSIPKDVSSVGVTVAMHEAKSEIGEDILQEIQRRLPSQPWPAGIHKRIAEDMNVSHKLVTKGIHELIRRGVFKAQVDGVLVDVEGVAPQSVDDQV